VSSDQLFCIQYEQKIHSFVNQNMHFSQAYSALGLIDRSISTISIQIMYKRSHSAYAVCRVETDARGFKQLFDAHRAGRQESGSGDSEHGEENGGDEMDEAGDAGEPLNADDAPSAAVQVCVRYWQGYRRGRICFVLCCDWSCAYMLAQAVGDESTERLLPSGQASGEETQGRYACECYWIGCHKCTLSIPASISCIPIGNVVRGAQSSSYRHVTVRVMADVNLPCS
jgi:hypothetical protein